MKRFFVYSIFTLLVMFSLTQCAKKANPVGAAFYQRENIGSERDTVYYCSPQDTFFQAEVMTGASPYLYVGQNEGINAATLLYFIVEIDSGTVDSAKVTLHPKKCIGDSTGTMVVSVHSLTGEWDEASVTRESFNTAGLLGEEIGTIVLDADAITADPDSVSIEFTLPLDLIRTWADTVTADQNHGLALTVSTDGFIACLYSDEYTISTALMPTLTLYVSHDTTQTTTAVTALHDAFIADKYHEPSGDRLIIGEGTGYRSALFFDVGFIPQNATINGGFLTLHADTLLSFNGGDDFGVSAYRISGDPGSFHSVEYDTTRGIAGFLNGDSLWLNLTFFVQSWTCGDMNNFGILLKGYNEIQALQERIFYSTAVQDSALKPRLHLFYSIPATKQL